VDGFPLQRWAIFTKESRISNLSFHNSALAIFLLMPLRNQSLRKNAQQNQNRILIISE
jgi:hypothetical protein